MTQSLPTTDDPALIADSPADVTPEWLATVLRLGSGLDAEIAAVDVERIGTGVTAANYRARITYAGDAGGAPPSVVVKMGNGPREDRTLVSGGFVNEVGFYLQLANRVRGWVPHTWYGALAPDHLSFTLLLDDLHPAVPGSEAAGCSPHQARDAVATLAALHTAYWNDATLAGGLAWLEAPNAEGAEFLGAIHQDATTTFLGWFGDQLSPADARTLREAAELTGHWAAHHNASPFTLLHGDYRLDNLMFGGPGEQVTAVDWQTIGIGNPGRDLAYFLSCSLPIDERREQEGELVAAYHAELVRHGVTGHSADDCLAGYRVGMLQGPMIIVLGSVYSPAGRSEASDAMFLSLARKSCRAIRELGTLDAVR